MKFLLLAVFAVAGYVGANCGCLKCSKHLHVLGEIAAPGQVPVKVICRCEQGYPNMCEAVVPVQPIAVQRPVQQPEASSTSGAQYPVVCKPFYKPHCTQGCYFGAGAIYGPGAAGNPCAAQQNPVYDSADYYGTIVPVKVQVPVAAPGDKEETYTLEGLRTAVDRIIIPAPAILPTGVCPYDRYAASAFQMAHNHGCGHNHGYGHNHGCGTCGTCGSYPGTCNSPCHRYDPENKHVHNKNHNSVNIRPHGRHKRHLLQHGYKFIVNMLPEFIKEPIKDTVNKMAITHPDEKLRKVYNIPAPPLTLKEKLELKHKENVEALKQKLYGKSTTVKDKQIKTTYEKGRKYGSDKNMYTKKYVYIDDKTVEEEAKSFIESLKRPEQKKSHTYSNIRNRSRPPYLKGKENYSWLNEMKSAEVLGKHFSKKYGKKRLSQKEKARFLEKLKKLNQQNGRFKRDTSNMADPIAKSKRSIIIGSDELDLPLYQIKIRNSDENSIDEDYDFVDDSDYDEEYEDYEDYDDYDESHPHKYFDASKEELIRNAIREELKKFRQVQSEEDLSEDPVSILKDDKIGSKFPLLRIIAFPIKLLKRFKEDESFPIIKSFPKMIVGTKKYFRDFGKNFKKNMLHFASDMIGDFDHYGPTDNLLSNIVKPLRLRRSIDSKEHSIDNNENEKYPNELNFKNPNQNFRNISATKVRKKRYILKMVDDDEVEELLRQKLGKIFDQPERGHKPKRKHFVKSKYYDNSVEHNKHYGHQKKRFRSSYEDSGEVHKKRKNHEYKSGKHVYQNSDENLKKKFIIEPIKPKVIIDNNGLPFMEVNGYKRPLFIKGLKKPTESIEENLIENSSFNYYDSSEEHEIDDVIDDAKNRKGVHSRNPELPLHGLKDKISQLLNDIDILVHMDFEKYDEIYDELIEIQSVKTAIVESWKKLLIDKKINDYDAKIDLLEKFQHLQHMKCRTMETIVYAMHDARKNTWALKKVTETLVVLHKIQCVIDQIVVCFHEKYTAGSKFELSQEIKFIDYLSSLTVFPVKTRNDMISVLKEDRDKALQEHIILLEKLKRILVEDDECVIEDEANILWEMKHIQKMQLSVIEEMCERLEEGLKIKKNLKILFDLSRRLKELEEKEKKICCGKPKELSKKDKKSEEEHKKIKKFDIEEFNKKWQEKIHKQKEIIEDNFKKKLIKLKEFKIKKKIEKTDEDD